MVFIKELVPNPAGKDTLGEWLALLNDGVEAVNLRGWSIKDASGKKFIFGAETLLPHQELKLPYSLTRINLNNDGDIISLYNSTGTLVDAIDYSGPVAEEEVIISSKLTPISSLEQSMEPLALEAQAISSQTITAKEISPVLIAFGLALVAGLGAALLTKKLMETD